MPAEQKKESLTTEQLRLKFKSQFELVNYSIKLAENMIRSGREPRVKLDIQNTAMQVLAEIIAGKDAFEDIPSPTTQAPPVGQSFKTAGRETPFAENEEEGKPTAPERKKPRKIFN